MSRNTSWEKSSRWYQKHMQKDGGYNHKEVILPKLLPLLDLNSQDSLVDLGCGQGFLARSIPPKIPYLGLDSSSSLIKLAKEQSLDSSHDFKVCDVTSGIEIKEQYTRATFILSLQNMAKPLEALKYAHSLLKKEGRLFIVLNHPCFRIPKYSSWGFLDQHKGQYRRIDRYLSPFRASLKTHPSKGEKSPVTYSFHRPLSEYSQLLKEAGFMIEELVEVTSNKKSYGKAARAENFARKEFPLFMIISAQKK